MSNNVQSELSELLTRLNQKLLLERIAANPPSDDQALALLSQLKNLEKYYTGGVEAYLSKAGQLVTDFRTNHQEIPDVMGLPTNTSNVVLDDNYEALEEIARPHLGEVAIVLVAGGLGERLGSKQIKVSIECEIISGTTFMELYLEYLKLYSRMSGVKMNLMIMTSDDTHTKTVEFLKQFDYADHVNLHIEKQDKVPAISDLECNLDVSQEWVMQTKPHGHGDVHFLIKQSGILDRWSAAGIRYVYFIQDTNPFSLPSLPVVLGNAIKGSHLLSFVGVLRKSQEPVGALVTDEKGFTYNIEYNVFDNFFKSKSTAEQVDSKGFGIYPGNINVFLLEMNEYKGIMDRINSMREFINIKFDKINPKKIASSWRVECLMQDIAFSISDPKRIHVMTFDRNMVFTTCKNNLVTGRIASSRGLPSETIVQCENDIYLRNLMILRHCGAKYTSANLSKSMENIEESDRMIEQIKLVMTPRIFIHPSFGVLIKDIRESIKDVTFDGNGDFTLVLKGKISIEGMYLNNVSLWLESCDPKKTLKLQNFKMSGKPEDVVQFISMPDIERKDGDLRSYRIDDPKKLTKVVG